LLGVMGIDAHGVALLVGSILILLGLYFAFLFKPVFDLDQVNVKATGVRKGFLLGMLNPQLIIFWSGVRLMLDTLGITRFGWIETIAFGLGAFTGALVLLLQLVRLGRRALEKWRPSTLLLLFRVVGGALVLSGAIMIMNA